VTPALRALRQAFPAARIEALAPPRSAAVLHGLSSVDEVIVFDKFGYDAVASALSASALLGALGFFRRLHARHYDLLILPHHLSTRWGTLKWAALALASGAPVRAGLDNGRGWFLTHRVADGGFGARHEVEHCLAVVENATEDPVWAGRYGGGRRTGERRLMEIGISAADGEFATSLLPAINADQPSTSNQQKSALIALHPGSGGHSLARRWPLDRWVSLGRALVERCAAQLVIVGTATDGGDELAAQMPGALNLTGRTTLAQLAAVLRRCDLFLGADSGVMHIAAAAGARVVALFGTTNPRAWGPWTAAGRSLVVQSALPGCPCAYIGFQIRSDECEARECMQGIEVEQVLAAAMRVLSSEKGNKETSKRVDG
jgi:ADP-heptose:LPS heptosyltransferase